MNLFSTASFCKTSVSDMTAKIGILGLLAKNVEMFVLKKENRGFVAIDISVLQKSATRDTFFLKKWLGLQDFLIGSYF